MSFSIVNQPRFGLKGRAAAGWLVARGIEIPQQPNTWLALQNQGRILRLGRGEFLVEGELAVTLSVVWQDGQPDLYRVPRYDFGCVLSGEAIPALLQEICALDTRAHSMGDQVLMTQAAGISVTLLCETHTDAPVYRLWCDATYGDYMHETLQHILN